MKTWSCRVCLEPTSYHKDGSSVCYECARDPELGGRKRSAFEAQDNAETSEIIEEIQKAEKLGGLILGGMESSFLDRLRKHLQEACVTRPLSGKQLLHLHRIRSWIGR